MFSTRLNQIDPLANNSFLQINNSGALVASSFATVNSSGYVNFPSTPLLTALLGTTTGGVTGNGTVATVAFDTIVNQQGGSNYNTGTGTYTFPVAGNYYIGGSVGCGSLTSSMSQGLVQITLTARNYQTSIWNWGAMRDSSNNIVVPYGQIFNVSASNTCIIKVDISNGGANTATINGSSTTPITYLSIVLVG